MLSQSSPFHAPGQQSHHYQTFPRYLISKKLPVVLTVTISFGNLVPAAHWTSYETAISLSLTVKWNYL